MREFNEIFFIKTFFRLLLAFVLLVVVCILTLNITDSVPFKTGEIVAEVPQIDYKAPFEAIPDTVFVKEGQTVKVGDTLMILINEQINKNYQEALAEYDALQTNNTTIEALMQSAKAKMENLTREKFLSTQTHKSQQEKLRGAFKSATEIANSDKEKLIDVALTKLKIDSSLYQQNVISKLEITNSFDSYLNYKNSLTTSEYSRDQIQSNLKNLTNEHLQQQNSLDLRIIELGEQMKQLNREKASSDKELTNAFENLNYLKDAVQKQFIIAEVNGEVMNLYNLTSSQNFVSKDQALMSVVPERDRVFAKVLIPQRDIRYIKKGQEAHLKFDAYSFYEKGILKGTVNYVPERKPKEDFFVIIDISAHENFELKAGYSIKGEIITERLKLYQFIAKKLFRKFENTSEDVAKEG